MENCREFVREVVEITAVPWAKLAVAGAVMFSPTLDSSASPAHYSVAYDAYAVHIGTNAPTGVTSVIPLAYGKSAEVKDTEELSVAGRLHKVTIEAEVDARTAAAREALRKLELAEYGLVVTYRDRTKAIVAATRDTMRCTVERDKSTTNLTIAIQNFAGCQTLL